MSSDFCSHSEVGMMGVISAALLSLSLLVRQTPEAIVSELIAVTSPV